MFMFTPEAETFPEAC